MPMKEIWDKDSWNERLVAYLPVISAESTARLQKEKQAKQFTKLIVYTTNDERNKLISLDFHHEANMSGFFNGKKAEIFTWFSKETRQNSTSNTENKSVLKIVETDQTTPSETWSNITFVLLKESNEKHFKPLTKLYQKVFDVYPTNIFDPEYIKKSVATDYTFVLAVNENGEIIGSASAMKTGYASAEITDCVVDPTYRGKNILHGIIMKLEGQLMKDGISNVFSITRARSVGMNMTIKRLSYKFEGTLVNNCKISSGYEDMNIWTKELAT